LVLRAAWLSFFRIFRLLIGRAYAASGAAGICAFVAANLRVIRNADAKNYQEAYPEKRYRDDRNHLGSPYQFGGFLVKHAKAVVKVVVTRGSTTALAADCTAHVRATKVIESIARTVPSFLAFARLCHNNGNQESGEHQGPQPPAALEEASPVADATNIAAIVAVGHGCLKRVFVGAK